MGRENCSDAKIMELHTHADAYTHGAKMNGCTLAHVTADSCTHNGPITQLSANVLAAIDLFSAPWTAH